MATTNIQMVEALRGLLYDNGPESNGKASGIAAHIVAEHDMFGDSLTHVSLSREELATVLAGLRMVQRTVFLPEYANDILADCDKQLDGEGIDALFERLNGGEG